MNKDRVCERLPFQELDMNAYRTDVRAYHLQNTKTNLKKNTATSEMANEIVRDVCPAYIPCDTTWDTTEAYTPFLLLT